MKWGEYEKNYWGKIGENSDDVILNFGTPIDIDYEETCFEMHYNGMDVLCYSNGTTYLADIFDSNLRFGILNIGVGSPRKLVENIFVFKKKIIDVGENEYGIVDGINTVVFEYDQDDKVKRMYISRWYY